MFDAITQSLASQHETRYPGVTTLTTHLRKDPLGDSLGLPLDRRTLFFGDNLACSALPAEYLNRR